MHLKNNKKGDLLEQRLSKIIHNKNTAILASSLVLRELSCGQIDICSLGNNILIIHEVKSKPEGLSRKQWRRLLSSLEFLVQVFNTQGHVEVLNSLPKD